MIFVGINECFWFKKDFVTNYFTGINECFGSSRPRICTQNCTDKKIGYECSCYHGYKLLNDSKTCVGNGFFINLFAVCLFVFFLII